MQKMKTILLLGIIAFSIIYGCNSQANVKNNPLPGVNDYAMTAENEIAYDTTVKTIHIFVALCDNKYQGIVPVPAKIGNGQDPANNLYWGCGYGVKTYFKNSPEWKLIKAYPKDSIVTERLLFKHVKKNFYLIADAYDGQYIEECTIDFLRSSCGKKKDTLNVGNRIIGIAGNSSLLAYIGHDGLMDFTLSEKFNNSDGKKRDIIMLACYSKHYFSPHLKNANVNPLVWSTGLMAPEAYIIHDALSGYINNENPENIRNRAAAAYSRFQKCSLSAARKLLVSGW